MGHEAGSSAQLGTSIATFSADGADHLSLENQSPHGNNAECMLGPEPTARTSALTILSGALLTPCACQQHRLSHSTCRNHRPHRNGYTRCGEISSVAGLTVVLAYKVKEEMGTLPVY